MSDKDDVISETGTVLKTLPNASFLVKIENESWQQPVLCSLAGKMKMHFIKILIGDTVGVEISPYDLSRGRINYRHSGKNPIPKNN